MESLSLLQNCQGTVKNDIVSDLNPTGKGKVRKLFGVLLPILYLFLLYKYPRISEMYEFSFLSCSFPYWHVKVCAKIK